MKYTRIDLAESDRFAVLTRKRGSNQLEVELLLRGREEKHTVAVDDKDAVWRMAQLVQERLDGYRGCGGDVRSYYLPLELMSDL